MPTNLRIATVNLENLDDKPGQTPTLDGHIALMRLQLLRMSGIHDAVSLAAATPRTYRAIYVARNP